MSMTNVFTQGVKAVVTLNEDFEVFISSDQYKVCLCSCHVVICYDNAYIPKY